MEYSPETYFTGESDGADVLLSDGMSAGGVMAVAGGISVFVTILLWVFSVFVICTAPMIAERRKKG